MGIKKSIPKLEKVKYVDMPISIEEKRALNRKGYKVVDSKFDPNPKPKRAPKAKAEEQNEVED
jgi:hypothetical protein